MAAPKQRLVANAVSIGVASQQPETAREVPDISPFRIVLGAGTWRFAKPLNH